MNQQPHPQPLLLQPQPLPQNRSRMMMIKISLLQPHPPLLLIMPLPHPQLQNKSKRMIQVQQLFPPLKSPQPLLSQPQPQFVADKSLIVLPPKDFTLYCMSICLPYFLFAGNIFDCTKERLMNKIEEKLFFFG